ncbi:MULTISPECIES: hypothetical protein [Streptomyces]|uniref:Uncharacterized protein n=2 Tax=Streptomyces TaxID=1883 RepID=A0A3M8FA28_9ACTN|nr:MULTISPECIES: hypothetical protein [Streptomyces]KNE82916.1 hypothetical protein ADZ36_08655 [Streptomyces fradiae]OFA48769.1 hypothetical protein BEN35_18500 [Streptomyces fradiae]PQM23405.1 hypothetical protein Sfr7A_12685 [Streptomyces xinghaiensis]RKM94970.1 hypothetical protein SFRA_017155 [Streptomyces xinghaiensis]RNC74591.1 hypothetical protein DC095_007795 [Streptomyces xinghaiensis]
MTTRWRPDESAEYEVAEEVLHQLCALCSAREVREGDDTRAAARHWAEVREARTRELRALDPADREGVARFTGEVRELIAELRRGTA